MLHRGRLFSLSAPETQVMEKYIGESLATGLIRPSSLPAGAGFFFVEKKDKSLHPCIDYRGRFANFYQMFIRNYSSTLPVPGKQFVVEVDASDT